MMLYSDLASFLGGMMLCSGDYPKVTNDVVGSWSQHRQPLRLLECATAAFLSLPFAAFRRCD